MSDETKSTDKKVNITTSIPDELFAAAAESVARIEAEGQARRAAEAAGETFDPAQLEDMLDDDVLDEIFIEDDDTPAAPSAADAVTEAIIVAKNEAVEALAQTQKEAKDIHERFVRLGADFENYKKRARRDAEMTKKFAAERLMKDLLPVLDNLDRALASDGNADAATALKTLSEGVAMVRGQFENALKQHGVTGFSAMGEAFDPNLHEAMQRVEDASVPDGTVVQEYQRGYKVHERLLRAAMVVVSAGGPKRNENPVDTQGDPVAASEPGDAEA